MRSNNDCALYEICHLLLSIVFWSTPSFFNFLDSREIIATTTDAFPDLNTLPSDIHAAVSEGYTALKQA